MSLVTSTPTEFQRDSINQPGVSRCHRAAPGGRTNEINLLQNCSRIVAACRQTAAIFCKTKECGSLPRSRYAGLSGMKSFRRFVAAAPGRDSFFNYLNHFIFHRNRLFTIVSFAMVGRTECNHVINCVRICSHSSKASFKMSICSFFMISHLSFCPAHFCFSCRARVGRKYICFTSPEPPPVLRGGRACVFCFTILTLRPSKKFVQKNPNRLLREATQRVDGRNASAASTRMGCLTLSRCVNNAF